MGGNISVELSLFVLLYNANFMNKLILKYLKLLYTKDIKIHLLYTFSSIYKITPFSNQRKGRST